MNSRRIRQAHSWVSCLLAYLVFSGFVPFFSELRSMGSIYANNPYHNFELAWGLMHIIPALGGVALALWYLRHSSIFSAVVVAALTLQILFALLEYRREGFDTRMAIGLTWSGYLMGMLLLACPFAVVFLILMRKHGSAVQSGD